MGAQGDPKEVNLGYLSLSESDTSGRRCTFEERAPGGGLPCALVCPHRLELGPRGDC